MYICFRIIDVEEQYKSKTASSCCTFSSLHLNFADAVDTKDMQALSRSILRIKLVNNGQYALSRVSGNEQLHLYQIISYSKGKRL